MEEGIQYLYAERIRCLSKSWSVVENCCRHRDYIIGFFGPNEGCMRQKSNQGPECVMSSYEKINVHVMQFHKDHCETPDVENELSEENASARMCSSNLFSRFFVLRTRDTFVSDNLKCDCLLWSGLKILHHIRVPDLTQEVFTDNDIIVCPDNQFLRDL